MPNRRGASMSGALVPTGQTLPATLEEAEQIQAATSRALRRNAARARAPARIVSGGGRVRKADRAFRLGFIVSFVVCVLLPTIAASLYWGALASDQYASEVKFTLRASEASPLESLGGLLGGGAGSQAQESEIIANYVQSRTMLEKLDAALDLRAIYARPGADYFARLDDDAKIEEIEKYWRHRSDVKVESLSNIVMVNVRAFTPEDSLALVRKISEEAEKLVNDLSTRSRRDALTRAQAELTRAEAKLKEATQEMQKARDVERVLDASSAAEALTNVISALRIELAHAEQNLASQMGAGTDSPQSRVLRARIAALKRQIADYSGQIAGVDKAPGGRSMADSVARLSLRQVDLDVARQQYAQSATIFEAARMSLETQQTYLAAFLTPALAQKATYPRRWWRWSLIVFPCLLVWGLLVGAAFVARDHMAK